LLAPDRPMHECDERIGTISIWCNSSEQRVGVVIVGIQIDVTEPDRFVILDPFLDGRFFPARTGNEGKGIFDGGIRRRAGATSMRAGNGTRTGTPLSAREPAK